MPDSPSTFVVTREDHSQDPVTFVAEGLAIGRLPDCEVNLNHPTVSRLHAGIREIDGLFYVFHLSPSNSTTLNGALVEEKSALADGDVLQIGPFFLFISLGGNSLEARVRYQPAVRIGDVALPAATRTEIHVSAGAQRDALDVFWEKRKREAGKMTRPSQLRPHAPPRLGMTRHNWTPTRDLVSPYPLAVFSWGLVVVGILVAVAAFAHTSAFAPAPLSDAHARNSFAAAPPVAARANANACTTCHIPDRTMNEACASCHQTQAFHASTTDAHAAAGIGCATCHAEHRGRDFRPGAAALGMDFQTNGARAETCAGCHSDANRQTYNGRKVFTPHGGTLGYPVVNGRWAWKGLSEAEWNQEPDEVKSLLTTWKTTDENARRSQQFHALHLHRVRAIGGLKGNEAGELTCSSCHKSLGASLDRQTPRTTCAACHDGLTDEQTGRGLVASGAPNCISCHVQHTVDPRRWGKSLLASGGAR
ncbi:MAG: FHA domain-containing protein [Pyrinomonadaceae bacterium]